MEKENNKEPLSSAFFELYDLVSLLDEKVKIPEEKFLGHDGGFPDATYILYVKMAIEKVNYYTLKYKLEIDGDDHFWIEDLPKLCREVDKLEKEFEAQNGGQATKATE